MENKHQRQQALQREIIKKINGEPLIEITDKDLKLMDEINNNTQTKMTWSEPTRWFISTAIVALFLYAMYSLYKYELIIPTFFMLLSIWMIACMIILVKDAINILLD